MEPILPQGAGTRPPAKRSRLKLTAGQQEIEVLEMWDGGFAVRRDGPRFQRGFVDIFDGGRHLCHGLAYPTAEEDDRRLFAFKITQRGNAEQPRDYAGRTDAPLALLPIYRR